jgi:hypothetical protein
MANRYTWNISIHVLLQHVTSHSEMIFPSIDFDRQSAKPPAMNLTQLKGFVLRLLIPELLCLAFMQ